MRSVTTEEEVWKQDYMSEARQRYGEEYTTDRYHQSDVDGMKENVFVKKIMFGEDVVTINNDDWETHSVVKELNNLVGLEW